MYLATGQGALEQVTLQTMYVGLHWGGTTSAVQGIDRSLGIRPLQTWTANQHVSTLAELRRTVISPRSSGNQILVGVQG